MPTEAGTTTLRAAREALAASRRAVAFTGAGVSTASGVPDFRSPGGLWSRYQPVTIQEFVRSEEARRRYWQYKREAFADFARARPNAAHLALARLEQQGRLRGVITQNVDGLHQEAGSRNVLELHGTNRHVVCLSCQATCAAAAVQARLEAGCDIPECEACGGLLKPATVSFGQALPQDVLREAFALATSADVMLVLGSSLVVYPAASIPEAAAAAGAALVLVNREETPLDHLARVVLHGAVEEVLPELVS
jgi:NAD-dependent protein deacetylase/lipoamidase